MDTIKLSVDGHEISFSTKSLTIDDKVYLYTGISAIKHSSAKKLYLFKYEDSWHKLPYEEKDQKKVATIFKRVAEMNAKRSAKAEAPSPAKAAEDNARPAEAEEVNKTDVDTVADTVSDTATEPATVEPETAADSETAESETVDSESEVQSEDEADAEVALTEEESPAEDKGEESEGSETEETESEKPAEAESDESAKAEGDSPELSEVELRKKRLKKAFAVLAVIIALFVLAGVAYFFIFGTSKDASQSPNTDSKHEYNDIDELIDEMNE